tara:strand:- start:2711 stop:3103 length:393 start_codon:yes stop_codon:yes gene_type:complete
MSFKAYLVELKSKDDIAYLDSYLSEPALDGVAWLDHIYRADTKLPGFSKHTLVAALTADRADLASSMEDEAGLAPRPLNIQRLDNLPDHCKTLEDHGCSIKGWTVPKWTYDTWVQEATRYIMTVPYGARL